MQIVTRGPSRQEWAEMRPIFTRLYFDEGKTLEYVRALLASQYGFKASVRMYKTRIGLWGLDKKRKASEMRALVSMALERQRAGKRSRFRIRGHIVPLTEAQKYFRRKGITNLGDIFAQSDEVLAPSDLTCSTAGNSPEPINDDHLWQANQDLHNVQELQPLASQSSGLTSDPSGIWPSLSSPEKYSQMEQLLVAAREYFRPSSNEFSRTIVREDLVYSWELQEFENHVQKAAVYADLADWEKAAIEYGKALARVPKILRGNQSLNFLVCLFVVLGCCENGRRSAFIPAILRFVSEVAAIVLPSSHPFCQMIQAILRSSHRVSDMIELAFKAALDILENLSFDPRTRIIAYGLYETLFSRGNFFQARELIRETWRKEELHLGKRHTLTIWSMMAVGQCSIELGDFPEASGVANDVIQRMQMVTDIRTHVQVHINSCTQLRRRRCGHRQLFNAFSDALDASSHTPVLFGAQHET
jgi:tetratricopeptide (TPR) repeat protein